MQELYFEFKKHKPYFKGTPANCCNQNQKVSVSNPTSRLASLKDLSLLQSSRGKNVKMQELTLGESGFLVDLLIIAQSRSWGSQIAIRKTPKVISS